ncbi:hypothetical protein HPB50_004273 [Hyalomma asiaticum]|uniref:Uncharacterized protein n=1 Tax=Hyalomma asiaticum TaxID=266040 RepID=A0ACB7TE82_HYAAI|nr:hypothetical protein HPB50_004273 [Hyalomma asiaticum]
MMPPPLQKFASKHKYGKRRKKSMLDNFKKRPAASQVEDEPSTASSDGMDGADDNERGLGLGGEPTTVICPIDLSSEVLSLCHLCAPTARDQQNMGRGRGRGRGGFDGGFGPPGGPGMGRGGRGRGPGGDDVHEVQYTVPANKCGLVIGKGGEAIRQINQQSGAHVELSRAPPPNPVEKVFIIRGNPQQIEHAQQLINERIGGPPPGAANGQGPPNYPTQYPQPYQQPPPPNQPYAPQGWGNAYQHWQNQSAPPNDPSKAAADANAAAWAAYYAQYYGQQGGQPPQTPQPPQAGAAPAMPSQAAPQPQQQQQPPQAGAPAGAQPDYSQAWIEYYRSLGMFREAEMIEQQARGNQTQQDTNQGLLSNPSSTMRMSFGHGAVTMRCALWCLRDNKARFLRVVAVLVASSSQVKLLALHQASQVLQGPLHQRKATPTQHSKGPLRVLPLLGSLLMGLPQVELQPPLHNILVTAIQAMGVLLSSLE